MPDFQKKKKKKNKKKQNKKQIEILAPAVLIQLLTGESKENIVFCVLKSFWSLLKTYLCKLIQIDLFGCLAQNFVAESFGKQEFCSCCSFYENASLFLFVFLKSRDFLYDYIRISVVIITEQMSTEINAWVLWLVVVCVFLS